MCRFVFDKSLKNLMPDDGKCKCRRKDSKGHGNCTPCAPTDVTHKSGEDDQRCGQQSRKRETIQKLGIGHPTPNFNCIMLNEWNGGVCSTKGEQPSTQT